MSFKSDFEARMSNPQGLKPASSGIFGGTAEAVPFRNLFLKSVPVSNIVQKLPAATAVY
jgi:hypothetical protein